MASPLAKTKPPRQQRNATRKGTRQAMPRLTPEDASLLLDHVVGGPSIPAAVAYATLTALPFPSRPTPRLLCRLAADLVSPAALDSLQLLASLPSPSPAHNKCT
uniref:Uncharacterized protein n=1 Tax=Oryza meridionalis TaxID=40149 RepID=A0A0E0C600_9ORYZ